MEATPPTCSVNCLLLFDSASMSGRGAWALRPTRDGNGHGSVRDRSRGPWLGAARPTVGRARPVWSKPRPPRQKPTWSRPLECVPPGALSDIGVADWRLHDPLGR